MTNPNRNRRISSVNRSSFAFETNWGNLSKNDPRLTKLRRATRVEDLNQEDLEEVKKIFPQELMEVLEFNDYKKILFEHLENPEFQNILKERFKAHDKAHKRQLQARESGFMSKLEKSTGKAVEEMTTKEIEELEESKKKE